MSHDFRTPIIIAGAARSGTKMLRNALSTHPQAFGLPYELPHIWRYGNENHPNDELGPSHARPEVVSFIRKSFFHLSQKHPNQLILDKSAAHGLRLKFVLKVFPEARFVHIVRDGRDASVSARLRWKMPTDFAYLIKNKAFLIPVRDMPSFAHKQLRFLWSRIHSGKGHVDSWGPRFFGIDSLHERRRLIEICALQWHACVTGFRRDAALMEADQHIEVRYEEIVQDPISQLGWILRFLGLDVTPEVEAFARTITPGSVGRWRSSLTKDEQRKIGALVGQTLRDLGYV